MERRTFLRGLLLAPVALVLGKTGLGSLFPAEGAGVPSGAAISGKVDDLSPESLQQSINFIRSQGLEPPQAQLWRNGKTYTYQGRTWHLSNIETDPDKVVVNELWVRRNG